jgi:hypothetical protein
MHTTPGPSNSRKHTFFLSKNTTKFENTPTYQMRKLVKWILEGVSPPYGEGGLSRKPFSTLKKINIDVYFLDQNALSLKNQSKRGCGMVVC